MAISRDDAEAGWELYRDSDFSLQWEELNAELARSDRPAVSHRTFRHYGKLRRFGYEGYIPINQLDVHTIQDPIWDKSLRSRYLTFDVHQPAVLLVPSDGGVTGVEASVVSLSDGEAVARVSFERTEALIDYAKRVDTPVQVVFTETGESRLAELDKGKPPGRLLSVLAKVRHGRPSRPRGHDRNRRRVLGRRGEAPADAGRPGRR